MQIKLLKAIFYFFYSDDPDNGAEVLIPNKQALLRQIACVICDKPHTSKQKLFASQSEVVYNYLKKAAKLHRNRVFLAKLKLFKINQVRPAYHRNCYITERAKLYQTGTSASEYRKRVALYDEAFESVKKMISTEILSENGCVKLSQIYHEYSKTVRELFTVNNVKLAENKFYIARLKNRIRKHFAKEIKFCNIGSKVYVCKTTFDISSLNEKKVDEAEAFRVVEKVLR